MKHPAFVLLLLAPCLHAGDWPEFRGPTGQGHYVDGALPTHWSADTAVWKQPIPGKGWSSPVVVAGKIYLTTAVPREKGGQSLRALCLDAKSGKILWDEEVFAEPAGAPQ